MATKRTPGSRPGLILCDHCGEEYSSSYRRCPFCDEYDEYEAPYESSPSRSERSSASRSNGGKRLVQSNRRGGGYTKVSPLRIIAYIISLIVILFAIWIVVAKIMPLVQTGDVDSPPDTTQSGVSDPAPNNSPDVPPVTSPDITPGTSEQPGIASDSETTPTPSVSAAPGEANGFSLNKSEFSFTTKYPDPVTLKATFSPAGTSSTITWSSSNTNYVTVDETGKVSPGSQKGTATITATMANGVSQTCKVHNQVGSSSSSANTETPAATGSYKLNKTDFTFERDGETTKLKVKDSNGNDYTGTISWSSSNTSIASISSDGTCKAVGNGTCNIIAALADGTQLKAIARVKNQT